MSLYTGQFGILLQELSFEKKYRRDEYALINPLHPVYQALVDGRQSCRIRLRCGALWILLPIESDTKRSFGRFGIAS